jgi:hypothetical protein
MTVVSLAAFTVATFALAWSSPTSTNLAPSSEVMGDGEIRLEISIVSYGGFMRSGTEHYTFSQFGRRRLEWGFDIYCCPDENGNYTKRLAFNAKIKLWDETAKRPILALGVLDIGKCLTASPHAVLGKS